MDWIMRASKRVRRINRFTAGSIMVDTPTVVSLLNEWIDAFNMHDLDRHVELYTEDANLFGSVNELQVGRAGIRQYFKRRGPGERVKSYPVPRVSVISPDVTVTAGHVEFANFERVTPYRMTWVLVRKDGNWKIAQHHGSPQFVG
jgi:uncharacterized protein (TIGR02246 family)